MSKNPIKSWKKSYFMNLALKQAQVNLGNTKENPSVGCVLVKNNSVISSACTSINGRPHAEYLAIKKAKDNSKNSDLYVTIEPCSHYGKTPPCVKFIIKNKVKRVIYSLKDPDHRSHNKSKKILKKNNIFVSNGILSSESKKFYKSYFNFKKNMLPYVTAKLAVSKDLFLNDKKNKWITNEFSRGRVHLMRSNHDCILTSNRTVIKDNPTLNCRIPGLKSKSPSRFIIDKNLRLPISSQIAKSANLYPTTIFFNKDKKKKIKTLKKLKIKLIKMNLDKTGNFNLIDVLIKIKSLGFSRIFLESGLNLLTNFLKNRLINDFYLFISNNKLKNNGINSFRKTMNIYFKKRDFIQKKVNLSGDKLYSCTLN